MVDGLRILCGYFWLDMDNITIEVTSAHNSLSKDSIEDVFIQETEVPKFEELLIPIGGMMATFIVLWGRKRKKKTKNLKM